MKENLKKIRQYFGLSQKEFAERLCITQNHVSSLESGRRILSDRTIKAICSEFRVNEIWLRTGEGDMLIDSVDLLENVTEEDKDILRKIHKLSDSDKDKMLVMLDLFLNEKQK